MVYFESILRWCYVNMTPNIFLNHWYWSNHLSQCEGLYQHYVLAIDSFIVHHNIYLENDFWFQKLHEYCIRITILKEQFHMQVSVASKKNNNNPTQTLSWAQINTQK